ncbi:hypothetical protein [Pseudomonas putida]|uniref:hypothetical protein n=1 Tax=Pseudomonas putida TaxID=303 RepID=UPI003FA0A151
MLARTSATTIPLQRRLLQLTFPAWSRRGVVITGGRVLDSDVRPAPSGVFRAYDAVSGQQKWAWDLGRPDSTAPVGHIPDRAFRT